MKKIIDWFLAGCLSLTIGTLGAIAVMTVVVTRESHRKATDNEHKLSVLQHKVEALERELKNGRD